MIPQKKKKNSYMFYKINYSSVVDNHSVLHVITVILSSTFIAANTEHLQRPGDKEILQADKYEAGYVITFVFFSLTFPQKNICTNISLAPQIVVVKFVSFPLC